MKYFYSVDGDDIGKLLEKYALENDVSSISKLCDEVKNALKLIKDHIEKEGAVVVFCEGDSILAYSENLIDLPRNLIVHNNLTFSAGIGRSTSIALIDLKKAKGLGKKRIEKIMSELE